jgi:hypothetical protein
LRNAFKKRLLQRETFCHEYSPYFYNSTKKLDLPKDTPNTAAIDGERILEFSMGQRSLSSEVFKKNHTLSKC